MGQQHTENADLSKLNFCYAKHISFNKLLAGKNPPAQLETDGQNLIGKGSQHSQQPSG